MVLTSLPRVVWLGSLLVLAACQVPAPPPEPAAQDSVPPTSPAARVAQLPEPRPVDGVWNFERRDNLCAARASHAVMVLSASVRDGQVSISVRPSRASPVRAGLSARLSLAGTMGSWRLQGRTSKGGGVEFSERLDEASASRLQALISGGTLDAKGPGTQLPLLRLAPAGQPGGDWFECIRQQLVL